MVGFDNSNQQPFLQEGGRHLRIEMEVELLNSRFPLILALTGEPSHDAPLMVNAHTSYSIMAVSPWSCQSTSLVGESARLQTGIY